jgi:large subunit ribosomal protein L4
VFGPHPRDYRQEFPVKMRRLALRCALSQRVRENGIRILENLSFSEPRTKQAAELLRNLSAANGALVVTADLDQNVYLSTRNIERAGVTFVGQLNIHDVMRHPIVVMPLEAARRLEQKLATAAAS